MSKTKKKKKIVWQQYIGMVFPLLIGIMCGFILALYDDKSLSDTSSPYQKILSYAGFLAGIVVAFFFHIIVHEAGHLLFGLMTGYKFSSFRIASFMWLKENGKIKLKRFTLAGTGGQCLMTPPDMEDGKVPFVLYNLGGVFINIITGALFWGGYLIFQDIPFLSSLFFALAVVGVITALANGIPMRMGSIDNDGYNALALSKNKEAVEALWVQLKVNEQYSKGVRLKDMPAEWFAVPADEAMKNSMVAARCVFACNRLMDELKFDEADALMAHLLEIESGVVEIYRNLLVCDRIYIELIGENRSEVIESMMTKEQKKFMKAMKMYPSVLRTQYAYALLSEKDATKAEAVKKDFEKTAKTYPYPQDIDSERDLILRADKKQ